MQSSAVAPGRSGIPLEEAPRRTPGTPGWPEGNARLLGPVCRRQVMSSFAGPSAVAEAMADRTQDILRLTAPLPAPTPVGLKLACHP